MPSLCVRFESVAITIRSGYLSLSSVLSMQYSSLQLTAIVAIITVDITMLIKVRYLHHTDCSLFDKSFLLLPMT